jgi:hypothetical protein
MAQDTGRKGTKAMTHSSRILGAALAGLYVLGASAAQADVFVFADINKTKTLTVNETIDVTKLITLTVEEQIDVDSAAEQHIFKNQRNQFNSVEDETSDSSAQILDGSASDADGVVLFNQAPGIANNQGNEVSITFVNKGPGDGIDGIPGTYTQAESSIQQINGANVDPSGNPVSPNDSVPQFPFANQYTQVDPDASYSDTIGSAAPGDGASGPFEDGSGVVGVNQAAGALNNQNNALAIALGDDSRFAVGEADLGQFNAYNFAKANVLTRADTIQGGAFAGFSGVAMVNQAAGIANNQANQVDIAGSVSMKIPEANTFGTQ